MRCSDCPRFDKEARRCLDGKVNPQKWNDAVETANVLGVRVICTYNDFRERLVQTRTLRRTSPG